MVNVMIWFNNYGSETTLGLVGDILYLYLRRIVSKAGQTTL